MKNMGQMGKLLKQAQKMQAELAKAQEEVADLELEHSIGGGMISVKINGSFEILSIKINPDAVDKDDVETLEDLVLTAVNGAIEEIRKQTEERMSKVTGGMPGLGGIF